MLNGIVYPLKLHSIAGPCITAKNRRSLISVGDDWHNSPYLRQLAALV